ncbi:MAG: MerR family transcriptional regulator [Atopobiaceae bacterium]|nr:MerR family transcriptional regulator [Atopobiaceae bacterium]
MPDAGYLTIGKVVKRLQQRYPDLSVSKVRYLEDEGLITPARTPGGYRLYSQHDINRLETILHLQKTRFLPLQVIKEELERGESGTSPAGTVSGLPVGLAQQDDDETTNRLHPIDRMPEITGAPVSFVRQLAEVGVIPLKRSPHGRDLVDGHDLQLIRVCHELSRFGIGPRNLRQYVTASNRESAMFEQALVVYARKGGGVEAELTDERRERFVQACDQMLALTNQVRDALIRRQLDTTYKEMGVRQGIDRPAGD